MSGNRVLAPCWSCGADNEPCFDGCECVKCISPDEYQDWKDNNPDEYELWLEENTIDYE